MLLLATKLIGNETFDFFRLSAFRLGVTEGLQQRVDRSDLNGRKRFECTKKNFYFSAIKRSGRAIVSYLEYLGTADEWCLNLVFSSRANR